MNLVLKFGRMNYIVPSSVVLLVVFTSRVHMNNSVVQLSHKLNHLVLKLQPQISRLKIKTSHDQCENDIWLPIKCSNSEEKCCYVTDNKEGTPKRSLLVPF